MNKLDLSASKPVILVSMIEVSSLSDSRHRHLVIEAHKPVIQVPLVPVKLVDLVRAYDRVIQVMHNLVTDSKLDCNREYSLRHQLLVKRTRLGLTHHKPV